MSFDVGIEYTPTVEYSEEEFSLVGTVVYDETIVHTADFTFSQEEVPLLGTVLAVDETLDVSGAIEFNDDEFALLSEPVTYEDAIPFRTYTMEPYPGDDTQIIKLDSSFPTIGSSVLDIILGVLVSGTGTSVSPTTGISNLNVPSIEIVTQGQVQSAVGISTTPSPSVSGVGTVVSPKIGTILFDIPTPTIIAAGKSQSGSANIVIANPYIGAIVKQFNEIVDINLPLPRIGGYVEVEQISLTLGLSEDVIQPKWAYDIHKKVISVGEAYNQDAINQSIENILSTLRGERVFNLKFGTILPRVPFEEIGYQDAVDLLDRLVRAIKRWEKRVIVLENQIEMNVLTEENAITLVIPYMVKRSGLTSTFSKKINL